MAQASRSSKRYRERAGLTKTVRSSLPTHDTGINPVHSYPLTPPLPLPELQQETQGDPPPDRDVTEEWPPG